MQTNKITISAVFLMFLCVEAMAKQHDGTEQSELEECANYGEREQYADALKKCDQAIALTDDKAIHAVAYMLNSISHLQLGSYEQSIQDGTTAITLIEGDNGDIPDNETNEAIAYAYFIRATSTYELALNTIGGVPITDKEKQPYREALQDMHKAIALHPEIAEDEEARELRNKVRRLAH